MSSYTIKSGDNLWNICKREFKLNSNSDIAKKVKEVAAANGISDPNRIFAGKELNLSCGDTVEITSTKKEEATPAVKTTTSPVKAEKKTYSAEIEKAFETKEKSWNIKTYDDFMKSIDTSVSIFSNNTVTDEQKQNAYHDYSEKLLLEYYDLNKDGKVTSEEFAKKEEQGALKTNEIARQHDAQQGIQSSEEDVKRDNLIAGRLTNLFAKNLDMNGDGIISKEEFAFFNKTADAIDGKTDGVIKAAAESAMVQSVTGMNAENAEINRVVNKYLMGETLTADEQKILDDSSVKIRAAMSKAAGFNS